MTEAATDANAGAGDVALDENGFIPGTSYKSVPDLIKGHAELKGRFDAQGNELGNTRKEKDTLLGQAATLAETLRGLNAERQPAAPKGPDYDAEIGAVQKQLLELDPMAEGYQQNLANLVAKTNQLTAISQHEKTLNAAGEMMKKELSDRDQTAQAKTFYDANPTFSTPEMQARIKEYIANDKTGMHDPMSAYFQIQRDDVSAKADALATENAEMKKVIELAKGKEETGKVIVKGQSPGQITRQPKATGKDLDAGMLAALKAGSA